MSLPNRQSARACSPGRDRISALRKPGCTVKQNAYQWWFNTEPHKSYPIKPRGRHQLDAALYCLPVGCSDYNSGVITLAFRYAIRSPRNLVQIILSQEPGFRFGFERFHLFLVNVGAFGRTLRLALLPSRRNGHRHHAILVGHLHHAHALGRTAQLGNAADGCAHHNALFGDDR